MKSQIKVNLTTDQEPVFGERNGTTITIMMGDLTLCLSPENKLN
jgi:hypothetical protein